MTENNNNTNQFVKKLAEREGVAEEKIKEIIIESFRKSYCQGENANADLHFEFSSVLLVYRIYKIVEKITDQEKEVSKDDSKFLEQGKIEGDTFFLPLDTKSLSFSLNYEIKKRLQKDLGGIHGEKQYKMFKSLEGQLVRGIIQSYQEKYYIVKLEKGLGYWEKKEWILPEKPRLGQVFYFLVKEVNENVDDRPQILLTRHDELFLVRLLEGEIPEIKKGIISIRKVLRVPGLLSKLIVESKERGVDPLGTCIGQGAERIRTISRLIYPERLDIAIWSEDKRELFFNLLSPVKVVSLIERGNDWNIIVPRKKVSLLLEHQGKVLKVIGNFLEKTIHVQILEELEQEKNTIIVWNGNLNFDEYQKFQ